MKPWLWIPAKLAHDLSPVALQLYGTLRRSMGDDAIPVWNRLAWRGLEFPNRLGIAGGVDKDASLLSEWWTLGCGFVEVGTVTPRAQSPNPGKIIGRSLADEALWNRMGFPGSGAKLVRSHLLDEKRPWPTPVFINIGKNRDTDNSQAHLDYRECMNELGALGDAFVINISSPNTSGLRELLLPENFRGFLQNVMRARAETPAAKKPILLKISPDMTNDEISSVTEQGLRLGLDGFIATNTTLARGPGSPFPSEGGVSGRPLASRAKEVLVHFAPRMDDQHLLVSVGGVMSKEDVQERLEMGADLVQVYSALIFEGPGFFRRVGEQFASEIARDLTLRVRPTAQR